MHYCKNCGEQLTEEHGNVCPRCGTSDTPHAPAQEDTGNVVRAPRQHKQKKPASRRLIFGLSALAVILSIVLVGGMIATNMLYERYNSATVIEKFTTALLDGDTDTMERYLVSDNLVCSQENLASLCRAFPTSESVDALKDQLTAQAQGTQPETTVSNAFDIFSRPFFMGYNTYFVSVNAVSLRIPADVQTPLLTLDGATHTGVADAQGVLYEGLFPGQYNAVVSAQSITNERIVGHETALTLLDTTEPTVFDGALKIGNITVENCQSDTAVITVNGIEVPDKPVNGTVSLVHVSMGSTIAMRYETEYGATITASAQFTDMSQTALRFESHESEGGVPAQDQLNGILSAYFASYLNCLNAQDLTLIQGSTSMNDLQLATTLANPFHLAHTLAVNSVSADYATAVSSTYDVYPATLVNVEFVYGYSTRADVTEEALEAAKNAMPPNTVPTDDKSGACLVRLTVELIFRDGTWFVNRTVPCSNENYDAHILTPIA